MKYILKSGTEVYIYNYELWVYYLFFCCVVIGLIGIFEYLFIRRIQIQERFHMDDDDFPIIEYRIIHTSSDSIIV